LCKFYRLGKIDHQQQATKKTQQKFPNHHETGNIINDVEISFDTTVLASTGEKLE